jgi:hypothetical protein
MMGSLAADIYTVKRKASARTFKFESYVTKITYIDSPVGEGALALPVFGHLFVIGANNPPNALFPAQC